MTRPDAFRVGHAGVVRLTAIVIAALIAGGTSILLLAPSSTATTCVPVSICNYDDATERVQLALESGASIDERGAMSAPPSGEITGQGGSPRTSTLSIHARFATNSADDVAGLADEALGAGDAMASRYLKAMSDSPVDIPQGWAPRVAFQRPGATGNADMIRVMDPTPRYPTGYIRIHNSSGQPVDLAGKTGPASATHIPR